MISPFQKCPWTPIIPLSTCPLQCECLVCVSSPHPPSLPGNLLCKYGLLTADGLFQLWSWKCNYRLQTSPLLSPEGVMLISVPSATGPLLITISFEEGITNEAIWKPFVLSKELAVRVCVFLCACLSVCVCASLSLSHTHFLRSHTPTHTSNIWY